jgi:superfamily II DNA or RNA helicase
MNMKLFDYQEEMVGRIGRAFGKLQSVMVQMPTGTGKTYLLAAVVKSEERRVKNPCVWVVAHRRELVVQIEETLARFDLPTSTDDDTAFIKVMSIQWLTLHYREMREVPSLIVIDEAHHAVAKTYAEVMRAFPKAKKLGLTATPYRLKGEGFADLFDTLLTSWSMERFIAKGRLSLYDYYSIKPDGLDQRLIDSLKKRGADGDYQQKELNEVMDVRPSLERLCMTVKRYVARKKGIVYAFSIEHAEHIAEFYRSNDINAVAISSKTPSNERKSLVEQFKKGKIRVLVSVDLFSEGFDCPDVQFIQLARPTLSLAKYLQMVGRGLRVAKRKSYCVILDNVGLYRRFGMPSADRNWQQMFEGRSQLADSLQEICMRINNSFCHWGSVVSENEEMMKILGHDRQKKMIEDNENDEIVEDKDGWIDRRSGLRFTKRPQTVRLLGVEFCTEDGMRFFPRIRSKFIDDKAYINLKSLELQVGRGINWKRKYISMDEPDKVYQLKDKAGSVRLYVDDEENCYVQGNPDMELTPIETQVEMNDYCQKYSRKEKKAAEKHQKIYKIYKHGLFYPIHNSKVWERDEVQKGVDEIWYVPKDVFGESYWVDGISGLKHYAKPVAEQRGFVRLLREGDWYYVRNIPDLRDTAFRNWQIVADDNICVINSEFLFLKKEPRLWFKILKKTDDFSYFVVREYKNFSGYATDSDIYITQDSRHGLRLESNGVPYVPYFQTVSRAELRKYNL